MEAKLFISEETESVLILTGITIIEVTKMVQVNINIEGTIHKAIRKEAIDRGIAMKALLKEMIEEAAKRKYIGKGYERIGVVQCLEAKNYGI